MYGTLETFLLITAILGSALIAGVFYAFSTFVMGALKRLPPEQGIAAMQSINIVVINVWFLGTFFGTGVVCLGVLALLFMGPVSALAMSGGGCYLIGCILVTMFFNVPLNNALAEVAADSTEGQEVWNHYLTKWLFWNHVRTLASLVASGLFIAALIG